MCGCAQLFFQPLSQSLRMVMHLGEPLPADRPTFYFDFGVLAAFFGCAVFDGKVSLAPVGLHRAQACVSHKWSGAFLCVSSFRRVLSTVFDCADTSCGSAIWQQANGSCLEGHTVFQLQADVPADDLD